MIECANLQVNESALTGESLPQEKQLEVIAGEVGIADQTNMVFSSGLVTNGTGKYIVTKIGMNTEVSEKSATLF